MRGFQVENRREISLSDAAVSEEMIRLSNSWCSGTEEVVSAYFIAMCASCAIVFLIVGIHNRFTLGALDIDEADRVVYVA